MENKRKQFVEKYDKTVGTISDFFFFFKKNYQDREDSTDYFGKGE